MWARRGAGARVMIEILFVGGQKTYSMRAMLDACALRAPCAVVTLSDDPSLGEAMIDAFGLGWPLVTMKMIIINIFDQTLDPVKMLSCEANLFHAQKNFCKKKIYFLVVRLYITDDKWVGELHQQSAQTFVLAQNFISSWKMARSELQPAAAAGAVAGQENLSQLLLKAAIRGTKTNSSLLRKPS